jgi:hypothetical protein
MVTLRICERNYFLLEDNETEVKEILRIYPTDSDVAILETGEVLKLNDIFDYEGN